MIARRGSSVSVVVRREYRVKSVQRHVDRPALTELREVSHHQIGLELVRMIVVERRTVLEPEIGTIPVVAIVLEDRHPIRAETLNDFPDDSGLPRA